MVKITPKPKTYGPVHIHLDDAGDLTYGEAAAAPTGSPVEILLAALGACIARSIEIAAASAKQTIGPVDVTVSGRKAADLPNRVARYEIRVDGGFTDDPATAQDLLAKAKAACTVSNSLNGAFDIGLFDGKADV